MEEVDQGAGRSKRDTKVVVVHWGDEGDHNLTQVAIKKIYTVMASRSTNQIRDCRMQGE